MTDEALRLAQELAEELPYLLEYDGDEPKYQQRKLEQASSTLTALRSEVERLRGELDTAQHWRERHCRESEANAKQSGENWQKWKAASALSAQRGEDAERWQWWVKMWPIDMLKLLNSHLDGLDDMTVGEATDAAMKESAK